MTDKHPMRQMLEDRARELCGFPDPENYTDTQLLDAIKAEQAAAAWMARYNELATEEAQRAAVRRLGDAFREPQRDDQTDRR